jgi:Phosphotransferase enzyme family
VHGAQLSRLVGRVGRADAGIASAALDGRLKVADLSRSHPVGLLSIDGVAVVVAKGGSPPDVRTERAVYSWLASSPATAALAPSLHPHAQSVDEVLLLRPEIDAVTLHYAAADAADPVIAHLGRMLGTLHSTCGPASGITTRRPWILSLADDVPELYADNPAAQRQCAQLAADRFVSAVLVGFARRWKCSSVIHGDIKFDNVLVSGTRLSLIDWELACIGDPAWDVAGVVDGLLLPELISGTAPVDRRRVLQVAAPVMAAHRSVAGADHTPSGRTLLLAITARIAQSSIQVAAMGNQEVADVIAGAAVRLARELAEVAA